MSLVTEKKESSFGESRGKGGCWKSSKAQNNSVQGNVRKLSFAVWGKLNHGLGDFV